MEKGRFQVGYLESGINAEEKLPDVGSRCRGNKYRDQGFDTYFMEQDLCRKKQTS